METGKRLWEHVYPRRVKRRMVFDSGPNARLDGFEAMWTTDCEKNDLTQPSSVLFAEDAFIRKEYVEMYDAIRKSFEESTKREQTTVALVRGSSGVGKSAFLQYFVARIRNEATSVLIVRADGDSYQQPLFLHLSTSWFGQKTVMEIVSRHEAKQIEKHCDWTIVDGCDWEPQSNFVVGASSSTSTPWRGFRNVPGLLQLYMPPWSLQQMEQCRTLSNPYKIDSNMLQENYKLVGGNVRWALTNTEYVVNFLSYTNNSTGNTRRHEEEGRRERAGSSSSSDSVDSTAQA